MSKKRFSRTDVEKSIALARKTLRASFTRAAYDTWQKSHKDHPTLPQVLRFYKNWRDVCLSNGIIPVRMIDSKYTEEQILFSIQACADDVGVNFTEIDYNEWRKYKGKDFLPSYATVRNYIGKDGMMLETRKDLGMPTSQGPMPSSVLECKAEVMLFVRNQLSQESYVEWAKKNNRLALTTLEQNAGNLLELIEEIFPYYIQNLNNRSNGARK